MAVFVSASDESTGKHHRDAYLFAGFVAPEEDWSRFFAPAWQERVLDGPPAIPYLHMTDIRSSQWRTKYGLSRTAADDRVDEAIALIDSMGSFFAVGLHVDAGIFRDKFATSRVVSFAGVPRQMDPDYICFLGYALIVLAYVATKYPSAEKVDFVIERNGQITKYIQEFHSRLGACLQVIGLASLSGLVGELIPAGKERIPLQAADVLCWHTARPVEAMDRLDMRRYATLARLKGKRTEWTHDDLCKLDAALTSPTSV